MDHQHIAVQFSRQKSDEKRNSSGEAAPTVPNIYMVWTGRGLEGCTQIPAFDWLGTKKEA